MDEGRPVPSGNAPAPATLATVGLCLFVIGLAIGVFQPLFVIGIGAGLVAGPTCAGLLFLLCNPIALVTLVLAFFGAEAGWLPTAHTSTPKHRSERRLHHGPRLRAGCSALLGGWTRTGWPGSACTIRPGTIRRIVAKSRTSAGAPS